MWKLHKVIYALKQAPRAWFDKLKATLLQFNFLSRKYDPSSFIYADSNNIVIYILVYGDDIIVTRNNFFIKSLVTKIYEFCLKDLGFDYFLGIEVRPQPNGALVLT